MKLRKIAAIGAATAALVGIVAGPASAADDTNILVTGGSQAMTTFTAGDFAGVTLDGTTKTTAATVDTFSVTDATGAGAGWKLSAQGTQFAEWDSTLNAGAGGYVVSGRMLALNSLDLGILTATGNGTTSAAPTMTAAAGIDNEIGAVKFASAAVDQGMGKYDIGGGTGALSLSIPASAYATTYRSDLTVTLASTP